MKQAVTDDELKQRLTDAGVGLTNQRLAIARFVLCEADHPTANEVYEQIETTLLVVSKATVYNTLGLLVEAGLLCEVRCGPQDSVRYDGNTEPHHHLRDQVTGRLIDIPYDEIEIANLDALKERYKVKRIMVTIDGEAG
jgi:Fur family iron response transcriptional regulator|tara:strand:+ start:102 stop:518 length:417 start_codon:yes stop_codon:yes gene_type:complete